MPKRVITNARLRRRWWLFGPLIAAEEVVGMAKLCARCTTEYCTSGAGVFVPRGDGHPTRFGTPPNEIVHERRHPLDDEPRSLRDSDQAWDSPRR